MTSRCKIVSLILCAVLAAAFFVSAFTLAEHFDHDCTGSDCAVCMVLQQCRNMLGGLVRAAAAISLTAIIAVYLEKRFAAADSVRNDTPVTSKVRLLN